MLNFIMNSENGPFQGSKLIFLRFSGFTGSPTGQYRIPGIGLFNLNPKRV